MKVAMRRVLPWLALAISSVVPLAGRAAPKVLQVAAAADLKFALGEIVELYQRETPGVEVRTSFGSSGGFYAQIANGAPFDLFLSADLSYPQRLEDAGLVLPGTRFNYAIGRLVLWVSLASKLQLDQGPRALLDPTVQWVAIANPAHAPYGKAGVAALRSLGVYEAVKERLVYGENVSQAAQFVQSGNADVGILPLSLALAPTMSREGRYWLLPADSYPRMEQGGVVLRAARWPDAARAFAGFLTGPKGRAVLERYGFGIPGR